ncbi:MAG: SDR family oxidoreductase [Saprospiraceae bacterium]
MKKILVAGSTGYLGSHIVQHLQQQQMDFKAIARNTQKLETIGIPPSKIIEAQVTDKNSLAGTCEGIDVVISTIGITRQKDGLTYMDVDYQANKNLLEEAIKSGVKKFIYVSVLHGEELTHLKICEAKEKFVQALKNSGLDFCIIRPSGFFSDMKEFYEMAKNGRVYLFGNGQTKVNPIHGADLAKVCVDAISKTKKVINVGGREILSHQDIAEIAFQAVSKKPKITYIPDWVRRLLLRLASIFMGKAQYGTTEFFLNVMVMDMATNPYGRHSIKEFFMQLKQEES